MATATGKIRCTICSKEKATIKCGGCGEDFCYKHWEPHRQELLCWHVSSERLDR